MGLFDGVLGSLVGGIFGQSAQSEANRTNIKLNRENREWEERMSNTSWQRGTADMLKAGMNPMLAFSQGGAGTPQNSAATVIPEDGLSKGISSAAEKLMQSVALEQGKANIGLTQASTQKALAEAETARVTAANAANRQHYEIENIRKEIEERISRFQLNDEQRTQIMRMLPELITTAQKGQALTEQQTSSARTEQRLKEAELPGAEAEAEVWRQLGEAGKGANIGANALQQIIAIIRSIAR